MSKKKESCEEIVDESVNLEERICFQLFSSGHINDGISETTGYLPKCIGKKCINAEECEYKILWNRKSIKDLKDIIKNENVIARNK